MKCPKCGYNSFDHLESCKKCGNDLVTHKGKFGFRSLLFPSRKRAAAAPEAEPEIAESPVEESHDFGFDFMGGKADGAEPQETDLEDLLGDSAESEKVGTTAAEKIAEEVFLDFDLGAEETFGESAEDAEPLLSPSGETAFDATDEEDPLGEIGEESFDFDLNWSDPFEQGRGAGENFSPEKESSRTTDECRSSAAGEDETPDLAEVFLGSLGDDKNDGSGPTESGLIIHPPPSRAAAVTDADPGDLMAAATDAESPLPPLPTAGLEKGWEQPKVPDDPSLEASILSATDEQPSSTAVEEPPSSPPRSALSARLGAGAADLLVLSLIFALFVIAGEMALAPGQNRELLPSAETLARLATPYFLVLFTISFGYFTLFHFLTGQTPGKMLFGLRVEAKEGTGLLLSQAFLRSIGGLLSLLPAGLGYVRILFDRERRGWNDRLAGSRVVPVHTTQVKDEVEG